MSVVNQMLRDLDRRNSQAGEGLPQYLRPVSAARGPRTGWRIAAVLAASIAVGAGGTWLLKPGLGGLTKLLGMAPGEPEIASRTSNRAAVPQVASLASEAAVIRSDSQPAPVLPVPAPTPPSVIEQAVPRAGGARSDVTAANFAQAEVLVPPVMPPAEANAAAKPRRDNPPRANKGAVKDDEPAPRAPAKTARQAPEKTRLAPVEPVREPAKLLAQPAVPATESDAAAPRATRPDPVAALTAPEKPVVAAPKPAPIQVATAPAPDRSTAPAAIPETPDGLRIDKKLRDPSRPAADAEFRQAITLMNKGRIDEAMAQLRAALALSPAHQQARQTLVALLVERRSLEDAQRELEEGLRLAPEQIGFASLLARLMIDRGDSSGALQVLERHAPHASTNPHYRSFHAALLQRAGRHAEAVHEFRAALMINPNVGPWWMGLGISEQALGRQNHAASAFQNARSTGNLSPELMAFVAQRLRQLQ